LARGLVVAAYADLMRHADAAYVTLISLCFLPQFIHAVSIFILSLGMRMASRLFISDPAFLLTPVFSFWTYGPTTLGGGCYAIGIPEPKISLSFRLTWVNSFLTIVGPFVVVMSYDFLITENITTLFTADSFLGNQSFLLFFISYPIPLFSIALTCLLLVQHLGKCSGSCCKCFTENCLSMTVKTETFVTTETIEDTPKEVNVEDNVIRRRHGTTFVVGSTRRSNSKGEMRRGSLKEDKKSMGDPGEGPGGIPYVRRRSLVIV